MLAKSTGGAMVKAGGDTWFFITADYAFGHALERDTARFVTAAGGQGARLRSRYPFPATTDFSSFLLQAQASGAKVLGLANAGGDTVELHQAGAGIRPAPGVKLAALLMFVTDVNALGLEVGAGPGADRELLLGPERPHPRASPQRVRAEEPDSWPNMVHGRQLSARCTT